MCFTIPGKIIAINNNRATVVYAHESRTATIVTGTYAVEDYVIVQAEMVIEKVPKEQAEAWNEFLKHESP